MRIHSLRLNNYRCIGEMKLEKLAPITVLVGRNNTGKSALLEAIALVSTGRSAWRDALGDDLLRSIITRRGGWRYSDMMIKIGASRCEIVTKGEEEIESVVISSDIETVSEDIASKVTESVSRYVDQVGLSYLRAVDRHFEEMPELEETRMHVRTRLTNEIDKLKEQVMRNIGVYIEYHERTLNQREYAVIVEQDLRPLFSRLQTSIREIYVAPTRAFPYPSAFPYPIEQIIRSSPGTKSNTVFLLDPSIQYLQELQRRLARSGELLNLIRFLREKIRYFEDIREVNREFLVFLKGLKRPMPIGGMGDGFRSELALLSAIATTKNGVALIEEPETRLHPGFMASVASQIMKTASLGELQYIISTHNLDFIEFLLGESTELVNVVRMYRIEEDSGIDYEVLTGEEAAEELSKLKMDLRGV